jgi:SAM-dependent methyltransferase
VSTALRRYLVGQFGNPRGPVGWLAGRVMAGRPSNRLRNQWTVDLLDLKPTHRVLEIGYGPGLALELVLPRVPAGFVAGLDRAATMCDMAAARNRNAMREGRLALLVGDVDGLAARGEAALAGPFDRIFAVNVAMFWMDPAAVFATLAARLAADGRIHVTHQPRAGERSDAAALAAADRLANAMRVAGLIDVRIERLEDLSPIAVCVIGTRA